MKNLKKLNQEKNGKNNIREMIEKLKAAINNLFSNKLNNNIFERFVSDNCCLMFNRACPPVARQMTTVLALGEDDNDSNNDEENQDGTIENGTHSTTVQYTNPETGYMATYSLDIEVEDGHVRQINFPKGGWLDDTHISPKELVGGLAT